MRCSYRKDDDRPFQLSPISKPRTQDHAPEELDWSKRDNFRFGRTSNISDDNQREKPNHSTLSISSTGSSLRPLNDAQRTKLQKFQDEIRREMLEKSNTRPIETLQTKKPPASFALISPAETEDDSYCRRCGLSKSTRCVCLHMEKPTRDRDVVDSSCHRSYVFPTSTGREHIIDKDIETREIQTQTDRVLRTNGPKMANTSCQVRKDFLFEVSIDKFSYLGNELIFACCCNRVVAGEENSQKDYVRESTSAFCGWQNKLCFIYPSTRC